MDERPDNAPAGQGGAEAPQDSAPPQNNVGEAEALPGRYRRFSRLIGRLRKRFAVSVTLGAGEQGPALHIAATDQALRQLERQLRSLGAAERFRGLVLGLLAGIFAAFVLLPAAGSYLYSSKRGYLPPEYDALLKTKNSNEQALQILEHTFTGRSKGLAGSRQERFEARIDDSSTIRLSFRSGRRGLATKVGRRVGGRMVSGTVAQQVRRAGMDTVLSETVGEAMRRTTIMSVDRNYRSDAVLSISSRAGGRAVTFVNRYEGAGGFRKDFTRRDADTAQIRDGDHTVLGRGVRVPAFEDEQQYNRLLRAFLNAYYTGQYR